MKYLITALFLLLLHPVQAQNLKPKDLQILITKNLPEWANSFENFDWKYFMKVETIIDFEKGSKENIKNLKKFQAIYDPIISYSENGNRFIDIYSYQLNLEKRNNKYYSNIDVGQAIYLCEIHNQNWERIAYNEYSRNFDDIFWINENQFILVGSEKIVSDKNSPIIFIGNLNRRSFEIVINTNPECFQKENFYKSKKLNNIKIEDQD